MSRLTHAPQADRIVCRRVGTSPDGLGVDEYTLACGGLTLGVITLGGIVTRLWVPDRAGRCANVVLGFDELGDYIERNTPYFGAIVGRYANRIAGARFTLDGEAHQLTRNDGANCLHGGTQGFNALLWQARAIERTAEGGVALELSLESEHGDQGFPGHLSVRVRYSLGPDASWRIDYEAQTDRPTIVNLTHHDYFNLAGGGSALGHRLTLPASRFHAVDEQMIPATLADVAHTPFDFRTPTEVAARLGDDHPQLMRERGYDHHWLLDAAEAGGLQFAARLEDPASGRTMDVHTTEPGLQFYSGNFLDGSLLGTGAQPLRRGDGLCLETQHSPNSPNEAAWPSTVLRPGQHYRSTTLHKMNPHRCG